MLPYPSRCHLQNNCNKHSLVCYFCFQTVGSARKKKSKKHLIVLCNFEGLHRLPLSTPTENLHPLISFSLRDTKRSHTNDRRTRVKSKQKNIRSCITPISRLKSTYCTVHLMWSSYRFYFSFVYSQQRLGRGFRVIIIIIFFFNAIPYLIV